MGILDRRTYKQIEWHLYNYHDLKQEVAEDKEDIINAGGRDYAEYGGGQSFRSDPTAAKAMRLCKRDIAEYEKWLKVIEHVIKRYSGTPLGMLLQKQYFDELGEIQICRELHIERSTYYRWRGEIVVYTAMIAVQEKLIKVHEIA
jgi:RinA family phage transcriptional activator